jgi:hypothetical protein
MQQSQQQAPLRGGRHSRIRELQEIRAQLAEREVQLLEKQQMLLEQEQTLLVLQEEVRG